MLQIWDTPNSQILFLDLIWNRSENMWKPLFSGPLDPQILFRDLISNWFNYVWQSLFSDLNPQSLFLNLIWNWSQNVSVTDFSWMSCKLSLGYSAGTPLLQHDILPEDVLQTDRLTSNLNGPTGQGRKIRFINNPFIELNCSFVVNESRVDRC